jgi:ribonuclease HI
MKLRHDRIPRAALEGFSNGGTKTINCSYQRYPRIGRKVTSGYDMKTVQPELEFLIHYSFEHRDKVGIYTISSLDQMRKDSTKTIGAHSADAVLLTAIIRVLEDWAPHENVIITTSNWGLMTDLGGEQFQIWKRNGWRGSDGKLLERADLFQALDDAIGRRRVSFRHEESRRKKDFSQRKTPSARKRIRNRSSRS